MYMISELDVEGFECEGVLRKVLYVRVDVIIFVTLNCFTKWLSIIRNLTNVNEHSLNLYKIV
jgi:hypothetical protein